MIKAYNDWSGSLVYSTDLIYGGAAQLRELSGCGDYVAGLSDAFTEDSVANSTSYSCSHKTSVSSRDLVW